MVRRIEVDKLSDGEAKALLPTLLEQIAKMERELQELRRRVFGRSSEKGKFLDPKGLLPFAEFTQLAKEIEAKKAELTEITVPAHTRKVNKRRSEFPDHLPRQRTECTLNEAARSCPDCGDTREEFGEVVSKMLERIEFTYVHEIACKKYACRKCQGNVVTAPGIDRVLDKCLLGPNFLAQIVFDRFGNHMPYARLEKKYKAEGLDLSRSVLCSSSMRIADLLEPVYQAHRAQVLASAVHSVLQVDDTEAVQRNGNGPGEKRVNIWACRDQDGGVFFDVTEGRSQEAAKDLLGAIEGRLQCDGHHCYDKLPEGIIRIGCWSHARRKFFDAFKAGDLQAKEPLEWINLIFEVERDAKARGIRDPVQLLALRNEKSRPAVELLRAWCDKARLDTIGLPKGSLMDGVTYVLNQWWTLVRFLDDGAIREISNNGCERALRSVVIGRNNWLFFGSEEGARGSVVLMSLVQSCKELGISPLAYLRDVMVQVNQVPASRVNELTPRGYKLNAEAGVRAANARRDLAAVVAGLRFVR
jgi:transposase